MKLEGLIYVRWLYIFILGLLLACEKRNNVANSGFDTLNCHSGIPSKLPTNRAASTDSATGTDDVKMVLIPGGEFLMGSDDVDARADERPLHWVQVDSFYMDDHEVTNAIIRSPKPEGKIQRDL
jgi:formylglycine-generating enzyme required for sulfatase activity